MGQNILIKRGVKKIPHLSKVDVIIVSVDYNDFLPITLENNIKIFDSITVVTSINDEECQKICQDFNINCVVTERMYENEASFNKGKAINDGIKSLLNPNWILLLDADIIVPETFHESFEDNYTNINSLYVCNRVMFKEYQSYLDWQSGSGIKGQVSSLNGIGYFQLFNINSNCLQRIIYPENSNNAAGSDISFRNRFTEKVDLKIESIHLGISYQNWNGRETPEFIKNEVIQTVLNQVIVSDSPVSVENKYDFNKNIIKSVKYKICSFYFNTKNDPRLKNNFLRFIEQFEGRYENLIVGIIDYGDIDFKLPCETIIIKGDVNNKVWSKEIIINKVIDSIDDVEYLMWIDGDLIYDNLSWLDNIDDVVKGNDFVQLFENINYLNENEQITHCYKSIGFKLKNDLKPMSSSKISKFENKSDFKPGGAWLGRFSILKEKKLFEKMYVGGGDVIFLYGINGVNEGFTLTKVKESNEEIYNEAVNWINSFGRYNIGYLKETISHLYHGEMSSRNYTGRYKRLSKFLDTKIEVKEKNKIVVYTCISGSYDLLKDVVKKESDIDYICFTNQDIKSETWEIRKIPKYLESLEQTKIARCIKILPHLFLPEYEISIWVDGNIQVLGNINKFISENLTGYLSMCKHPDRICTYQEAEAVINLKKDNDDIVNKQVEEYREIGFPENNGMVQSNVIIRRHNDKNYIDIAKVWWNEVRKKSKRDQLSFNYSIWNKNIEVNIMKPSIISSEYFQIWTHTDRGNKIAYLRKNYDSIKNYINGIEV
jgi:hypothetical protein